MTKNTEGKNQDALNLSKINERVLSKRFPFLSELALISSIVGLPFSIGQAIYNNTSGEMDKAKIAQLQESFLKLTKAIKSNPDLFHSTFSHSENEDWEKTIIGNLEEVNLELTKLLEDFETTCFELNTLTISPSFEELANCSITNFNDSPEPENSNLKALIEEYVKSIEHVSMDKNYTGEREGNVNARDILVSILLLSSPTHDQTYRANRWKNRKPPKKPQK